MIKTFTSYHHANDQGYKEAFANWASQEGIIDNLSVNTGDIDPSLPNETIRRIIRDRYLRDSEVTILLCGEETRFRKHVDWELKSSMIDGAINRRSGILVINLPTIYAETKSFHVSSPEEKELLYPEINNWVHTGSVEDLIDSYPRMPRRILENLGKDNVRISVVPWDRIYRRTAQARFLIRNAAQAGPNNEYDLRRKMRMRNYNPNLEHKDVRV